MAKKRIRVCMVLEGSYPFITGGVSAWVQDLIAGLPDVDFILYTISPKKDQELKYKLPANIVDHVDIVISDHLESKTVPAPSDMKSLMKAIKSSHNEMFSGIYDHFGKMVQAIPEGYFMYRDAVNHPEGWQMLAEYNQKQNPLYSFADYYWAWKSAHDMIFTVMGTKPPEADVYHAISTGYAGLAALAAKLRYHKPFLLTEHGLYHKEREIEIRKVNFVKGYQRDLWVKMYNAQSKIGYMFADKITALFEENRQKQIELGASPERTIVIPNGIDLTRFTRENREKRPGFHVGLVGRVVPIKDIKTFITSAKIASETIPDVMFHCIGPVDEDPVYYEDCKSLVKSLHIEHCFAFTGSQNVREYYRFLDLLMLTSVREAQPLVILEAYACGVPVVATKVGNIPEMMDFDERFLAPSKGAEKLAESIIYVWREREKMQDLINQNYDKVVRFYDRLDVHRRYRELYLSLEGLKTEELRGAE